MAEESSNNFESNKTAAMTARKRGAWKVAGKYFRAAEQAMREMAASTVDAAVKSQRQRIADGMRQLAEDCDKAAMEGRAAPPAETPDPAAASAGSAEPAKPRRSGVTYEIAERFQRQAKDAENRRDWGAASSYYASAADAFEEVAGISTDSTLADAWRARSTVLRRRGLSCEVKRGGGRSPSRQGGDAQATRGGGGGSDDEKQTSGEQWLVKEKPSIRFADVAGLEDVKEDIKLKMIYPFEHPELAKKFGVRLGGGVLFYGPPGTGKTMLAKATAGEVDAAFFRVSAADMLSKWVGEAEQNIKKLFDAAAAEARSIIFIDEIESLVPARRDEGTSVMQRVVPQILQGMEGFDKQSDRAVLFMGATNVPWQLDPAVLRPGRFDDKVYIPLPDLPARRKLLELYLSKRPIAKDIDLDSLATRLDGYSGADIKYICDRSATIPFLRSVATGVDGEIDAAVLDDVITTAPRSVTAEAIKKFEQWGQRATNS